MSDAEPLGADHVRITMTARDRAGGSSTPASLLVSEIFGPTIQGEGPRAGEPCVFLRLGACNLTCSWCDTAYTWDWTGRNGKKYDPKSELTHLPVVEVAARVFAAAGRIRHLVISGGEPMLQQPVIAQLLPLLPDFLVEIETNGTIAPSVDLAVAPLLTERVAFNVSPKLANSGNGTIRFNPLALSALMDTNAAVLKFVVMENADLDEIDDLVRALARYRVAQRKSPGDADEFAAEYGRLNELVWVMPEGRTAAEVVLRGHFVGPEAVKRGYHFTTRLQVLIWETARGH